MAYTEQDWIARFTGGAGIGEDAFGALDVEAQFEIVRAREKRHELELRQSYLTIALDQVESIGAELEEFGKTRIKMAGALRQKMDLIGGGGDPTASFGFEADMKDVLESPENMAKLYKAQGAVVKLREGLKRHEVPRSKLVEATEDAPARIEPGTARLFTDPDLESAFYTPLVRQLLLPEELVPDEFSQVQQMIAETNRLYIEKLETIQDVPNNPMETFGPLIQSATTAAANVALAGIALDKNSDAMKELANTGIKIAEACINTGIAIGVEVTKADAGNIVAKGMDGLSAAVGAALAQWLPIQDAETRKNIAKYVTSAMKGGSSFTAMVNGILRAKTPEEKAGAFLGGLQGLAESGYDALAVGKSKDDQSMIVAFKSAVTTTISTSRVAIEGNLLAAIQTRDQTKIYQLCFSMGTEIVKGGLTQAANANANDRKQAIADDKDGAVRKNAEKDYPEWQKLNKDDDKGFDEFLKSYKKGEQDKIDEMVSSGLGQTGTGASELIAALGGGLGTLDLDGMEAAAKKAEKERAEAEESHKVDAKLDAEERMLAREQAFEESLALLDAPEHTPQDEARLSMMIAEIKRDRAILQAVFAVAKLGAGIAGTFFAPMAAAGSIVIFIQESTIAIQRLIHLRKWMDSKKGALNAVSPYFAAITNFCENLGVQLSHHAIKAALNLIKAGASIASTAGAGTPADAVGKAIKAAADLAESVEEICYAVYKAETLEKAWKVTRQALSNPRDRKTNQIARKLNPTLAKYTIAWGGLVKKDPVASEALSKIGLTVDALRSKDADVPKVVEFLETLYDEDVQVYRHFPGAPDWVKKTPQPQLVATTWTTVYFAATNEGGVRRDSGGVSVDRISQGFRDVHLAAVAVDHASLATLESKLDDGEVVEAVAFDAVRAPRLTYVERLRALKSLLGGYKPLKAEDGTPHDEMKQLVGAFSGLADEALSSVAMSLVDIEALVDRNEQNRPVVDQG